MDRGSRPLPATIARSTSFDRSASKIDLDKVHLPTGWVTVEEVIRFPIVEFGVEPPCGSEWPKVLADSEHALRAAEEQDALGRDSDPLALVRLPSTMIGGLEVLMPGRRKPIEVTAIIEKRGPWFIGYIPEVPGVNVQERTLKATRESLRLALEELAELRPEQIRGRGRRVERLSVSL